MLQVFVNSLVYGSEIAIIAVGVALCYAILRFANVAHVQFAVVGAYASYALTSFAAVPLPLAAVLAALATGLLAVAIGHAVFARLHGIAPEGKMIVSWGVALMLRATVAASFGGASRGFAVGGAPMHLGGAYFTALDVTVVVATLAALLALHLLLSRSRAGTALRALASNPDLAETRGIPTRRMVALMWFISGAYAALGGTLLAVQTRLQPNMDLIILLAVFAAVTIGGLSNVFGAAAGALALALAQNLLVAVDFGALVSDTSWSVPTQFRDVVAVAAMMVILLLRPRGLTTRAAR